MTAPRLTPDQLRALADDAFVVGNWARRAGMRKEQQLDEVVKAFGVTLGYREAAVPFAKPTAGRKTSGVEVALEVAAGNPPALLKRPGEFGHLVEVCNARNAHGKAVAHADGFKSGRRVDLVRSFNTKLRDLLWRHRDDICALIYRANPDGRP